MITADGTDIVHDLRVWTVDNESATADVETPEPQAPAGWFRIRADNGTTKLVDSRSTTATHRQTGQKPPDLGVCRWVQSCHRKAAWMQAHPLMSPVPVCRTCAEKFDLH